MSEQHLMLAVVRHDDFPTTRLAITYGDTPTHSTIKDRYKAEGYMKAKLEVVAMYDLGHSLEHDAIGREALRQWLAKHP